MDQDKFTLGNFDGLEDDLDSLPEPPVPERENTKEQDRPSAGNMPVRGVDAVGAKMINHPSVSSNKQPEFRSPTDNRPLLSVELEKILPNEFQPRRIFNQEKLMELAESIRTHGIIQPLVVIPRDDGRFEIIVGERRFRAARIAGLREVPVFVNPTINSQTKLELALIENVQRADLNPIEEAKAYQQLREEFHLAVSDIAQRVGKDPSTISNLLRLLRLPAEIQRALVEEVISEGQARPLLTLRDHEEMLEMFGIIKKQGMKVRDIESKVRDIKKRQIKVREMFSPDPVLASLENLLRNKFGTRVMIQKKAKGGQIAIEFFSDEELNNIIDKLQ